MFSKALFKQSVKANRLMWAIVTAMVCFMLACVMVIGGGGNVGNAATGVTDTIIANTIESSAKKRGLSYYKYAKGGEESFDGYFYSDLKEGAKPVKTYYVSVSAWMAGVEKNAFNVPELSSHIDELPAPEDASNKNTTHLHELFYAWIQAEPSLSSFDVGTSEGQNAYATAASSWSEKMPSSNLIVALPSASAYKNAMASLGTWCLDEAKKVNPSATVKDDEYLEIYGSVMVSLNPEKATDSYFTSHDLAPLPAYDVVTLSSHYASDDGESFIQSKERSSYRNERAASGSSFSLAVFSLPMP